MAQNRDQFSNTTYSLLYNLITSKRIAVYFTPTMRISKFMEMDVPVAVVGGYNFNNRRIECFVKWSFGIDIINEAVKSQMSFVCNKLFAIIMSEALLIYDYRSNGRLSSHESIKNWYSTYFEGIIGDNFKNPSFTKDIANKISEKYGPIIYDRIEKSIVEGRSPAVKVTRKGENAELDVDGIPSIEKGSKVLRDTFGDMLDDEFKAIRNTSWSMLNGDELKTFADDFGEFGEFLYQNRDLNLGPDNLKDYPELSEYSPLSNSKMYKSGYNATLKNLQDKAKAEDPIRNNRIEKEINARNKALMANYNKDKEAYLRTHGDALYQLGLNGRPPVNSPALLRDADKYGVIGRDLMSPQLNIDYTSEIRPDNSFIAAYLIDDDFDNRGLTRATISDVKIAVDATKKAKAFYEKSVELLKSHEPNDRLSIADRSSLGIPPLKEGENETLRYGDVYRIFQQNYISYFKGTSALFAIAAEHATADGADDLRSTFKIDPSVRNKRQLIDSMSMDNPDKKLSIMDDAIKKQTEIDKKYDLRPLNPNGVYVKPYIKRDVMTKEADLLATFRRFHDEGRDQDDEAQEVLKAKYDDIVKYVEQTSQHANMQKFESKAVIDYTSSIPVDRELLKLFGDSNNYNNNIKNTIYIPNQNNGYSSPSEITNNTEFLRGFSTVIRLSSHIEWNPARGIHEISRDRNPTVIMDLAKARQSSNNLIDELTQNYNMDRAQLMSNPEAEILRSYNDANNTNYTKFKDIPTDKLSLKYKPLLPLLATAYHDIRNTSHDHIKSIADGVSGISSSSVAKKLVDEYGSRSNKFNPSEFLKDFPENSNSALTDAQISALEQSGITPAYLMKYLNKTGNEKITAKDIHELIRALSPIYDAELNFTKPNLLNCTSNKIKLTAAGTYEFIKHVTGAIGMLRVVMPTWEEFKQISKESFIDVPKFLYNTAKQTYRVGKLLLPTDVNKTPYLHQNFGFGIFADKDYFDVAYDLNFKIKKMYAMGKGTTRRNYTYAEIYMPVTIFQKVLYMQLSSLGDYNPEILFLINCANKGLESLL